MTRTQPRVSAPANDGQDPMKDTSMYFHEIPDDGSCLSKYAFSVEADSVCGFSLNEIDMYTELNNEPDLDDQCNSRRDSICSLGMSCTALIDDEDEEDKNVGQAEVGAAPVPSVVEIPKEDPMKQAKKWTSFHMSFKHCDLDESDTDIEEKEHKDSSLRGKLQRQTSMKKWSTFSLSSKKTNLGDSMSGSEDIDSMAESDKKNKLQKVPVRGRLQKQSSMKQWSSFRLSSKKTNLDDSTSDSVEKDEPKEGPVRGRLQRQSSLKRWSSFRLSKNTTGVDRSHFTFNKPLIQSQDKASSPLAFAA